MKKILLLYIPFFFFGLALTAVAQSSDEETEDPFKNDPFFSRPLHEFFKKSAEDNDKESGQDVKHYVNRLNDNGIDYDAFLEAGPYNSSMLYSVYPNLPMIHFNRVDGLYLGLEKERMQWYNHDWFFDIPGIWPHGLIGYSFGQNEWQYIIGLEKFIGRKNHVMIGAEYHNATSTDDYWRVGLTETTLTSFFAGYDHLDYYKQRGFGAYLILRSRRFFEGGIAYSHDRFNSQQRETNFALFGSGGRYRPNPPIELVNGTPVDTLDLSSLAISGSFNPKRLVLASHFTLSLSGMVEIADPGISGSDYSFTKYTGELAAFINFEPGGVLKYRFKIGSITGAAPNFKEFQLGGLGSLRAFPYKSLPGGLTGIDHFGNQMILSNAEIQFGSPSFSKTSWINFDGFYLSLFLDSGWTSYSQELAVSNNPFTGFSEFDFSGLRHNGGAGLGSSLFRVELAWDLENISRAPVLWIRLNPTF